MLWISFTWFVTNLIFFIVGHGGDGFLKFQDSEEITNIELADAFEQMWSKRRYHEIFFMIDTCQAASMYQVNFFQIMLFFSLFVEPNLPNFYAIFFLGFITWIFHALLVKLHCCYYTDKFFNLTCSRQISVSFVEKAS